jgi:predicted transcriptional regulator
MNQSHQTLDISFRREGEMNIDLENVYGQIGVAEMELAEVLRTLLVNEKKGFKLDQRYLSEKLNTSYEMITNSLIELEKLGIVSKGTVTSRKNMCIERQKAWNTNDKLLDMIK